MDTSPYRIVDLLPSARNMMDYCHVERGEDVAIFADTLIPPLLVQAVLAAVEERGGRPTIVTTQPGGLSWRTGGEPPRTYKTAMYNNEGIRVDTMGMILPVMLDGNGKPVYGECDKN